MALKINIAAKGKTWKIETDAPALIGKSIQEKIEGKDVSPELAGYELEITGGSDFAGFPMYVKIEGIGLKKVLLTKGWGMWKRPRREKKKHVYTPHGLRKRKTVRGKTISESTKQINLNVTKVGSKTLAEIFPEQNKVPEPEVRETPKAPEITA